MTEHAHRLRFASDFVQVFGLVFLEIQHLDRNLIHPSSYTSISTPASVAKREIEVSIYAPKAFASSTHRARRSKSRARRSGRSPWR